MYDRMPTNKEIADILGYSSVNSIQQYLKTLEAKGYLEIAKNKKCGISLNTRDIDTVNIPVVGAIACGMPILAQENIEQYIPVERQFVGNNPQKFFFLTAQGDSMDEAGIDDQDLLLIESRQGANPGDIVVILIGDEATVKYFKPGNGYVALVPKSRNPIHKPIILTEEFAIQGVVKKVIKKKDIDI